MSGARFMWSGLLSGSSTKTLPAATLRSFFTYTPPSAKSTFAQKTFFLPRSQSSILTRRFHSHRPLRLNTSKPTPSQKPNPAAHSGGPEPAPTLSQRLKRLTREYGWTALGVYFALSALDFPFCFLAVRALGTDRIGHYEHIVVETCKNLFGLGESKGGQASPANDDALQATEREGELGWAEGIDEADARNQGASASIWTQLALAYAIHKSFIVFRIPLTAAVLPKVVKTLRSWGYNIGKRKPNSP